MKITFSTDMNKFRDEYREKNFLLERKAIEGLAFSWADMNEILYHLDLQNGSTKILMNGRIPEDEFIDTYSDIGKVRKKIIKPAFYKLMRGGATLVLNRVNKTSWLLQNLCNQIARMVGGQTLANGYLAFKGNGSFGNHWDTHDVFVVQLYGRKRWLLYEPTFEYPLSNQSSAAHKLDCPAEPVFDEYLEAGDILYVPRGWWHNALPDSGPTFHIAIGVYNPRITDYLNWLSVKRLSNITAFRRSIFNENDQPLLEEAVSSLGEEFSKKENLHAFLNELISSERWLSEFAVEKYGNPEFNSGAIPGNFEVNSTYFHSVDKNIFDKINGSTFKDKHNLLDKFIASINSTKNSAADLNPDDISSLLCEDIISQI